MLREEAMRPSNHRPVGVFDSGVGGLTVLKALALRLPKESAVYLGDTARVPYGTKSAEVVTKYALANARLLLQHDIKLLVVACNTASAVALPALEAALSVPVVGVIGPGAAAAAAASRGGAIAVIGTPGTVASGAYQRALAQLKPSTPVRALACPLFVPLAEEGWVTGDVPRLTAERYLQSSFLSGVDTLVLGCTHYPLLREVLEQAAGPGVRLVDSAAATAEAVATMLEARGLLASRENTHATRTFLVTDTPGRFAEVGARFLGAPLDAPQQVDLTIG